MEIETDHVFKWLILQETNKVVMSNVKVRIDNALGEMGLCVSGKICRLLERKAALMLTAKYIEEF